MMHSVSEDDEYMGYHIPKDSVVVTNIYRIDRDEAVYPEPNKFRPERWIENPNLPLAVFGFGRRKCPGGSLARRSMFMALSRILWTYKIKPVRSIDEQAELSKIKERGHSLPSLPPPSEAIFEIRSPKHHDVVEAEWANVEKDESKLLAEIRGKVTGFGK
jgi:cytochrome P450